MRPGTLLFFLQLHFVNIDGLGPRGGNHEQGKAFDIRPGGSGVSGKLLPKIDAELSPAHLVDVEMVKEFASPGSSD